MASYTPCEGTGRNAVNITQYPGTPPGLGSSPSPAKTYGICPVCDRLVMERGLTQVIRLARHKDKRGEDVVR